MYGFRFPRAVVCGLVVLSACVAGCQNGQAISSRRLIEHQALIDFSGLKPPTGVDSVQVTISPPRHWELLPETGGTLYTHRQWRSPSTHTGVGVIHARLPLPLSAATVVWFAEREYSRRGSDGRLLGQWTDSLGRTWFEAENNKYHVRGYVVVSGFSAWVVYFGYRVRYTPDLAEIGVAARSAETAVPWLNGPPVSEPAVASR